MAVVTGIKFNKTEVAGRIIYKTVSAFSSAQGTDSWSTEAIVLPKGVLPTLMITNPGTTDAAGVGATTGVTIEGSVDGTSWAAVKAASYAKIVSGGAFKLVPAETDGDFPYIRVTIDLSEGVTSGATLYPHIVLSPK